MEYSSSPSAATSSVDPDLVHVLVSPKSAIFLLWYHLPWHVSKTVSTESRKDTWKNWKMTHDRKQIDTCQLLISPHRLLPACHVATVFCNTCCPPRYLPAWTKPRGAPTCPMVAASANVHTWIRASSDVSATRQRSKTGFPTKFPFVVEKTF